MTATHTRPTRKPLTLIEAGREFWRHPSPWMILATLVVAAGARITLGDWQITDAMVPVVMLAAFPFFEWLVHVCILHWRPRQIGALRIDPLLARKHREHHVEPRDIGLIFIPWQALLWVLPVALAIALLVFPRTALGLTFLTFLTVLGLCYEWCHYLIHTDYKPKTVVYRAVWRNHRQHHFKNEHFWFTVTSAGTADRVLGTCPDPASVESSPTVKNLHGQA
ncbi:fatty acid hydroxylase [Mycolicibacterium duvalii]|uniref:Fatty acid hydroxylase n=1 Tax=Mycolicibacterium duvalii TaxID=39688 RepID=A0A7I7JWR3_9MYCO|nr:sterol desaturase family protein [Mycolicibacterium duvalii]MCV7369572.1 sterol desaturase family protein [Mycolicibacterium duvalii]PEG42197.1 fatty acid hydroxylase [Mycolicibacterium duvalii]BBX16297.1 fatty acid hydroxylase [Mycolicibacterium duvalii]